MVILVWVVDWVGVNLFELENFVVCEVDVVLVVLGVLYVVGGCF